MRLFLAPLAALLLIICQQGLAEHEEDFHEELLLKPMPDSHVLAHFTFRITRQDSTHRKLHCLPPFFCSTNTLGCAEGGDYVLFPKPIGQLVSKFGITELSASLSQVLISRLQLLCLSCAYQGRWKPSQWGKAPRAAPPGAELQARFDLRHNQY
jgi:phosphatidylinositol glycan class T